MSVEFWELMDTIAKVGLGALIAGIFAYVISKLQHQQSVEQATVRRRLELIEEITAGVSEFANLISRYCLLSENILNALYRADSTIGEVPQSWIDDRETIGQSLKSGSALTKPEGLVYLIAADAELPKALAELQQLAVAVMNEAGQDIQDLDPHTLKQRLGKFKLQAARLMGELGKVYRKPAIR